MNWKWSKWIKRMWTSYELELKSIRDEHAMESICDWMIRTRTDDWTRIVQNLLPKNCWEFHATVRGEAFGRVQTHEVLKVRVRFWGFEWFLLMESFPEADYFWEKKFVKKIEDEWMGIKWSKMDESDVEIDMENPCLIADMCRQWCMTSNESKWAQNYATSNESKWAQNYAKWSTWIKISWKRMVIRWYLNENQCGFNRIYMDDWYNFELFKKSYPKTREIFR